MGWLSPWLLFAHDAPQVIGGNFQESPQLCNAFIGDVPGGVGLDCLVQKFLCLLVVCLRDIQRVFQRGFVFQRRFVFHAPIVGRFPGRFQ